MNLLHIIQNCVEISYTLNLPKVFRAIKQVLNEPSLYPDMPRKSYKQRKKENWIWYIKNKEPCLFYNSYGFDIKDFRNQNEYLPYRQFRIERNREDLKSFHQVKYENKLCLLRDKIAFAAYFGTLLGEQYVIASLGKIFRNKKIYDLKEKEFTSFNDLLEKHSKLFVKKLNGECGDGCYLVDSKTDIDSLSKEMEGSEYLIQDVVPQHEVIEAINDSCLNTIRIITVCNKNGVPCVFEHFMRFGVGNMINDNRATGGIAVGITEDGKFKKIGMGHHSRSDIHPKSGIVFEGIEVPYWNEIKELVIKAHMLLPEIPTIGWDVAITPDGPVLLEGNDNWEITGAQDTSGGLKDKWYSLRR